MIYFKKRINLLNYNNKLSKIDFKKKYQNSSLSQNKSFMSNEFYSSRHKISIYESKLTN